MVVERKPLSHAGRIVAWLLAAICLAAGSVGLVLGIGRRQLVLAVAATSVIGLGLFYAGAAWRGRPWTWR